MLGYRSHVGCRSHVRLNLTCLGTGHLLVCRSHVGVQVTCLGAGHMFGVQVTLWGSDNATLMGFVTGKY